MKVSIFDQYGALNSQPVFAAFKSGLDRLGIKNNTMDSSADVAVIWSVLWHGRMKPNQQIWNLFRASQRPVIVVEVGMLRRGLTWKIGINGTTAGCYNLSDIIPGRCDQLRLNLHDWTNSGHNIVIAAQRNDSEQWNGMPPTSAWITETINKIKQFTDKQIIVRPHPRQKLQDVKGCIIESPVALPGTYDSFNLEKTLRSAWAVINWNSGPGCQSIINGVPSFVGPDSLAAPVANLELSQIENPMRPDRSLWLNQLAHSEWTIPEIETGMPLERLLSMLTVPS